MKTIIFILAVGLFGVSISGVSHSSASHAADEHSQWIAKSLKEIEGLKVGMTRADLLSVFKEEGGISTRTWRRYAYHDCPYIKVDVEFEALGNPENKMIQSPDDRISRISKPFLEWEILD